MIDNLLKSIPAIEEKNRNYVLGGVLLVIFLVDYFLIMQPQLNTLRTLNPKVNILKQDLKQADIDIKRATLYQKQVKELEAESADLNRQVRTREEIPLIMEEITRVAGDHEIRIDQIMPMDEAKKSLLTNQDGKFFSVPILVEARGGYHDFGKFINDIEVNNKYLTVEKFTFAGSKRDTKKHLIKLTLKTIILEGEE